jgi:hypothetical protein
MPRERHFYSITLAVYLSAEIKAALESNDYAHWPPAPWFTSRPYYAGSSEARAARALLKATLDGQAEPLAYAVVLGRDGSPDVQLLLHAP